MQEISDVMEAYDDPLECLREMIFRQICIISWKRKETKIYMEEQYQLPLHLRKKALIQHRHIYDLYYNKICEIADKGLLRNIDKTVVTFSISAMMNWVYRWFRDNGRLSLEKVAEDTIRLLFAGIFKDGVLSEKDL